ncbi:hypothetical protein AOQ84DRAFT_358565 [Glonium stellatum]|uniref:F-box domain-containing protein n=1 Tax=Glonium stellatum TaxID=574774 RepID=A0A8E2FCU2_9PEZI|nr:hypothetical protein AOQ84DRAFT_358565 [Glonium stellatum]
MLHRNRNALKPTLIRLDTLPDDVLILAISQCCIDELFCLRLTSYRLAAIISSYITVIAPAVARRTFPEADLLTRLPKGTHTFRWLKGLIPKQLAAILVDRHRFAHTWANSRYGIPAEDPFGDELRGRVANGWCVFKKISNISQGVYEIAPTRLVLSKKELSLALFNRSRLKFLILECRENIILERRLDYIKSLPEKDAKDYKLMFLLLSSVFRVSLTTNYGEEYKPWIFDWGHGIDSQRLVRKGESWMTWYILHEGPSLFWQQWWVKSPRSPDTKNFIRDHSLRSWFSNSSKGIRASVPGFAPDDWIDTNDKAHSLQRDFAHKIQKALEEKSVTGELGSSNAISYFNPIPYFIKYSYCRRLRQHRREDPPKETMDHVPFHVDFRCPEELKQRLRILRGFEPPRTPRV